MSTQNRMIITEAIEEEDKNSTSSDDGASVRPVLGAMEENQTTQARRIGTVGQRTSDRDPVDLGTLGNFYRTASEDIGSLNETRMQQQRMNERMMKTLDDIMERLGSMETKMGTAAAGPFRRDIGESNRVHIRDNRYEDQPAVAELDLGFSARREVAKRRSTVFGRETDGLPDLESSQYREARHEIRTTSLTKAKDVHMKPLESLGDVNTTVHFLDEYNELLKKYSGRHEFTMLDFCARGVVLQMVAHAGSMSDIKLASTAGFTGGLYLESDMTIREIILDRVKARSFEDFTRKIKLAKFPSMDPGDITADKFELLYNNALMYTHNFLMYTSIISHRAKGMDILPLYRDGQQHGLVDYYLRGFPKRIGVNLYARACNSNPGFKRMESLPELTQAFMCYLRQFVELDQKVQDLSDTLSRKDRDDDDQRDRKVEERPRDNTKGRS